MRVLGRVYLESMWIGGTAWEVKESGELERRECHEGIVAVGFVEERIVGGYCLGICCCGGACTGGCCDVESTT